MGEEPIAVIPGRVSSGTRVACVIGWPVSHSLSPVIQNAAFRAAGLEWVYVAMPVPPDALGAAVAGIRALGIAGANVTMPHKAAVLPHLDEVASEAAAAGSVNTIVRSGDRLIGANTDGAGFLRFLERDAAFAPSGRRVLILGAGGAARSLAVSLTAAGASVRLAARRAPQADKAAKLSGSSARPWEVRHEAASDADLIVNATPLGSDGRECPLDPDRLSEGQLVVDLVYAPPSTPLVARARARGARSYNGLGMLLHQAALAFELWTGAPAPMEAMSAAAIGALGP
jgi:shikimate dehydrogenase